MIIILKPQDDREDEPEDEEDDTCAECGGAGWMPPNGDFDMRRCPNGCPRP
jgi:hypothetical protein